MSAETIISNIETCKTKLAELENQIKNINLKNYVKMDQNDIPEDKKEEYVQVNLHLKYNNGFQYVIFPRILLPIHLFNVIAITPTRAEKIGAIKIKQTNMTILKLFAKYSDEYNDQEIDRLYYSYGLKRIKNYDISKIIQFIKNLNIEDFDETKNTRFAYGRLTSDSHVYILYPPVEGVAEKIKSWNKNGLILMMTLS